MQLYKKECRPYKYSYGGQGYWEKREPFQDEWESEENEPLLREKYESIDGTGYWDEVRFEYRFVSLPKGHWTYIGNNGVNGLKICECSQCHKRTYGSHNYCPNCGADMRGENNE